MAELIFDGVAHTVTLKGSDGTTVGSWPANNRTDSRASLQFVPNGAYAAQDSTAPLRHSSLRDSPDGEFGSRGIVRFVVPGHPGVGVHSGRENTSDKTPQAGIGPDHVTEGCIRTTDAAMIIITERMKTDPLHFVRVQNNRKQR